MAPFYKVFLSTDSIHLKDDVKLHWCTLLCLILGDKGQIANFGEIANNLPPGAFYSTTLKLGTKE